MQKLITAKQAKQITGGHTPLVPVEYETAIKALSECITLDEAKYWSVKADALAAWAKIFHSNEAERKARALKLHAQRRMSEIAQQIRAEYRKPADKKGRPPEVRQVLLNGGLTSHEAGTVLIIGKMPQKKFESLVDSPRPPTPSMVRSMHGSVSDSYKTANRTPGGLMNFRGWCRTQDPRALARGMAYDEAEKMRGVVAEVSEWLDEFDRNLKSN